MSFDTFPHNAPKTTDFTPLISDVSQLLGSDLKARIRNDLSAVRTTPTRPANQEPIQLASTHDALVAAVGNLGKLKKDLDALRIYAEAAEQYAAKQLEFHSAFKTYVERTNQLALRSELVAPIRRLPNEVLQLIFLKVHARSTEREQYNPIPSRVCGFWRQLAEATPFLWTSLNVNLTLREEDAMDAVAHMEIRIKRARQHLVRVRFAAKANFDFSRDSGMQGAQAAQSDCPFNAAIATLLKYGDRVASLNITNHDARLGGHLLAKCGTGDITFKNLHTLSLYEGRSAPDGFNPEPLLKACPNLNRLRIFEVVDTLNIPWENLREFKGRLNAAALSAFISRARNVEQAEVSPNTWSTVPNITFSSRLTALSLGYLNTPSAVALAAIPPPSGLRALSLGLSDDGTTAILVRSWGHVLEFLELKCEIRQKHLKNLLSSTPGLRSLRLRVGRVTLPNIFSPLSKLTHLEIRTDNDSESEQRVRKALVRPLNPTPRTKRLPLRSVAFLPGLDWLWRSNPYLDEDDQRWKQLSLDLKAVGIQTHEYRTFEAFNPPTFKTAFFEECGWCV